MLNKSLSGVVCLHTDRCGGNDLNPTVLLLTPPNCSFHLPHKSHSFQSQIDRHAACFYTFLKSTHTFQVLLINLNSSVKKQEPQQAIISTSDLSAEDFLNESFLLRKLF